MSTIEETTTTTQVYAVWIKATPQAIWDAITTPEWTEKYGYKGRGEYDLRPGGAYSAQATPGMIEHGAPEVVVTGEVIEVDPPRKLVQTWHFEWDGEVAVEPSTRVTWEIKEEMGLSKLTVIHELENAPQHAAYLSGAIENAGGGWSFVLSDLKTLLETGKSLDEG